MRSHISKISPPIKKPPPISPRTRCILPAEHTPHTRTLMAFPTALSLYPHQISGARSEILNIAHAISKFEPVTIFVHPDDSLTLRTNLQEKEKGKEKEKKNDKKIEKEKDTQSKSRNSIDVKEITLESLWLRDTGPVFILDHDDTADGAEVKDRVRGVDFKFNYWGSKLPLGEDIGLSTRILQISNIEKVEAGIVAEGGGIETDGEGTLLVCASSIVNENRNPGMSREVIEEELMGVLGVEKVVWLEGVRGEDITDCHVDALARFVRPGMVVLSPPHRHGERGSVWWKVYEDAKRVLEREKDAKGRSFEVVEIEEPDLEVVEQETEMVEEDEDDEFSSVFSYVNYLVVNRGVIAPKFGDQNADRKCKEVLQSLFPDREVIQVHISMLPRAGGGIHCATQQVPAGRASR
ncbi:putative peptidyl-arginine deiminase family protein [Leptodontidium sp. MPI-SDFR-AT-0119]|nr:putative peptidyl-arginine deiminase family protein [Leptodontidium sp. MPI-SDFR-AT-0119]